MTTLIKAISAMQHTVTSFTVRKAAGVSEYVYANADAQVDVTVNGRPLTVIFQNGHSFKANDYACPSNTFIVGDNSNDFLSKLDRLSDDADQDDIEEVIEMSGGVLTTEGEVWALKSWCNENTPSLEDLDLSDDIDDYDVEVDEFGSKFVSPRKSEDQNLLTEKLAKQASKDGAIELRSGVFLHTSEDLTADQKTWDDEDDSKNTDFSISEFWITTNDGIVLAVSVGDAI